MKELPSEGIKVPESLLVQIWKGQWIQKGTLLTGDGRHIKVISPGIENKDRGPDFLGAVVIIEGEQVKGDVELHIRSSDWKAHGHHRDPHFNGVILQVVLWDDAKEPALLQNGKVIPTLTLHNHLNGSMEELSLRALPLPLLPCQGSGGRLGEEKLAEILSQAGEERFYLKAALFEVELILEEAEEVLYRGIMGALGYAKNKEPFRELACRLPLRVLRQIGKEQKPESRRLVLQALLLGAAGLLPSQCGRKTGFEPPKLAADLEEAWSSLGVESALSYADWQFFRTHPRNFPSRRLLAAGFLVERFLEPGLLDQVLGLISKAKQGKGLTMIEDEFIVPDLLGRGRAREIVVNILLPFFFAWGEVNSKPKLKRQALEIYQVYPRLGENQITRYLSKVFWGRRNIKVVSGAQHQQGLIHLYKTFCLEQRCARCPITSELS